MIATGPVKAWTVFVWAASDNDLYACEITDLDKFERVGPTADTNYLVTVDHRLSPSGPHTMQRLEIQKDDQPGLHSIVRAEVPSGNMACPHALADFIQWGIQNYPAEHYWVIISDHGDAWHGACEDEGHGTWMSLPQIHDALTKARQVTGEKLDILSFDCCHMASVEVAHELKDEARYMLASEEVMGWGGLDYEAVLPDLPQLKPRQVCERIVAVSGKDPVDIQTFSAIDMGKMPAVSQAFCDFKDAIVQSSTDLTEAVKGSESYWEYRDAWDLADRIGAADPTIQPAAEALKQALNEAVVAERHSDSHPGSHGLIVEVQPDTSRYGTYLGHEADDVPRASERSRYSDTAFARDVGWDEAIAHMTRG